MQAHITCSAIIAAQQKRQLHACFMHYEHHSLQVQHVLSALKKGLQKFARQLFASVCTLSSQADARICQAAPQLKVLLLVVMF